MTIDKQKGIKDEFSDTLLQIVLRKVFYSKSQVFPDRGYQHSYAMTKLHSI